MYFVIAVGAFSPSTVRGLIQTYTRGFITTVIPILVSATPLYFGWLSLSARKYGKQFEWHYKSAPYILDSSVFLPGNMVSSMKDITKVPPIFWMAQSFCQEIWQAL